MKTVLNTLCAMLLFVSLASCEPTCVDERLEISLFAQAPKIVQPVSAVVDGQDRLLVIENHTHFRPEDYVGPSADRILILEDRDRDGAADSVEVFFEGEKDSMDLALASDGSIYLATRRKIVRLEDTDGDGTADLSETIVRLETEGNYPHNGLSGLVFDLDGLLQFGFGENLGASYKLIGSDGATLTGGAEGGSTYRCTPNGKQLERIATGFWNPFGQCMDAYGNIFAVDNDPDATPPCRLLHVTEGANFGYQFRYGRPGNHPLQTWTGELPGTIGMVAGTGEAPCEVIYCMPNAKNGLPKDYAGDLLVASWGDHRIERFQLKRNGASFEATRSIVIQGDTSFWPVGIAVAKDGSLYITDWGSRSYPLHGEGKVWKLTTSELGKRQAKPKNRKARRQLPIEKQIKAATRMRDPSTSNKELVQIANSAETIHLRAMAVRLLGKRGNNVDVFAAKNRSLPIRREAFQYVDNLQLVAAGLKSNDATLRSLATRSLAQNQDFRSMDWFTADFLRSPPESEERMAVGVALVCESIDDEAVQTLIPAMLQSKIDDVRLVAARWVADQKLEAFLPQIEKAIGTSGSNFRLLLALIGAKQHLHGGKLDDTTLAEALTGILEDETQSVGTKALALRAAGPNHLAIELIENSLASNEEALQREAVYLLLDDEREEAFSLLDSVVQDESISDELRADAMIVADRTRHDVERLVSLASHDSEAIGSTAVRLLTGETLTQSQRAKLPQARQQLLDSRVAKSTQERTLDKVLDGATKRKGNRDRGQRLFHNTRLLQCSKCHRVRNRGANIGPELTGIANTQTTEQVLRSIIHPNERIAPRYQPWTIVDKQGRARTGYHLASKRLVETFVESTGERFEIAQDEIEERMAGDVSIMPSGLINHLTNEEVSDLLAYLAE